MLPGGCMCLTDDGKEFQARASSQPEKRDLQECPCVDGKSSVVQSVEQRQPRKLTGRVAWWMVLRCCIVQRKHKVETLFYPVLAGVTAWCVLRSSPWRPVELRHFKIHWKRQSWASDTPLVEKCSNRPYGSQELLSWSVRNDVAKNVVVVVHRECAAMLWQLLWRRNLAWYRHQGAHQSLARLVRVGILGRVGGTGR